MLRLSPEAIALSRSHDPALDGLRGMAAWVVLVGHAVGIAVQPHDWMAVLLAGQWVARAAVIFFFVLSGHVIARVLVAAQAGGGIDFRRYAIARLARIYPPFLLSLALVWGIAGLLGAGLITLPPHAAGVVIAATPLNAIGDALFLFHAGTPALGLNGALWSLRLEVICYALSALAAVTILARAAPLRMAVAAAALLTVLIASIRLDSAMIAFLAFGAGAATALNPAMARKLPAGLLWPLAVMLGGVSFVLTGASDGLYAPRGVAYHAYQLSLVGACVALLVPGRGSHRLRTIAVRWRGLADSAYTLFITHLPIITLVLIACPALLSWPIGVQVAVMAGASLAFAIPAARFVERPKPVRAWLERRLPGGSGRPQPAE